ncbi:MAG TPA: STAS domain-containing protein [Bryobacteraceae bacterium]|jgi:anti-sigma B factor antagonist|nr:STAS domain-containing protein [Bryobacteraceae bacterium]
MPLEVHQREVEGILILDLRGRLILGPDATDLRGTVASLNAQGKNNVIVNLKEVDYIDSTGLGTLVIAHSTFEKAGGAMKLLHLSKRSAELLILTKLSTVFQMFDDEQAAINSFFPGREVRRFDILEFVKSQENQPEHLGADAGREAREA